MNEVSSEQFDALIWALRAGAIAGIAGLWVFTTSVMSRLGKDGDGSGVLMAAVGFVAAFAAFITLFQ